MTPDTPDDNIESSHFMECPVCGVVFDMRDLGKVFEHIHDGPEMPIMEMPSREPPDGR